MNRRAVVYQPPYISSLSLSLSSLCSSSFLSLPRFLPFFPPFFLSFLSFFFFFFFSIVLTVNGSDTMTSSLNGEASLRGERPFVSRQTSLTSLFLADRAPTRPKLVRSLWISNRSPPSPSSLTSKPGEGGRVFPGRKRFVTEICRIWRVTTRIRNCCAASFKR